MFSKYHYHCKQSPVLTSFKNYSSIGAAVGSSFAVADGDGKIIVVYGTTYLTSQKCIVGFMVVILCNH